jgi:Zn-dependent protease with chaperone function
MRAFSNALFAMALMISSFSAAALSGVVQKSSVDVYSEPRLDAAKVASLKRDTAVSIAAQQGLWYQLLLPAAGYVRVNDVRIDYAGTEDGEANLRVLTGGKAGQGRVTETAGVRGIDESDLKSAAYDGAQLNAMMANRVDDAAATAYAREHERQATAVAYENEAKRGKTGKSGNTSGLSAASGMFGSLGQGLGSMLGTADKVMPKSEEELSAEELALGPEIAGRVLGARPLWEDAQAQQRVNLIGRWVAMQTSRPDLPWVFGVIDSPEVNAFAAPGGYVMVTRGLYELLSSDGEVAAVLAHEISHCVQRDHYNVVRNQQMATMGKDQVMGNVNASTSTQNPAVEFAKSYVEKHGATVMLATLDREAEYRSDKAAEIYVARAGMNPMTLYSVLQKMTALGNQSAGLAQLYKTHPALDARMDRIDKRNYEGLKAYLARD